MCSYHYVFSLVVKYCDLFNSQCLSKERVMTQNYFILKIELRTDLQNLGLHLFYSQAINAYVSNIVLKVLDWISSTPVWETSNDSVRIQDKFVCFLCVVGFFPVFWLIGCFCFVVVWFFVCFLFCLFFKWKGVKYISTFEIQRNKEDSFSLIVL